MVNEEKVILMTKIAMYKESLGREDLEKGKYFQSDYVKLNCLKTIVSSTVLFVVFAAAYIYYNLADIVEKLRWRAALWAAMQWCVLHLRFSRGSYIHTDI